MPELYSTQVEHPSSHFILEDPPDKDTALRHEGDLEGLEGLEVSEASTLEVKACTPEVDASPSPAPSESELDASSGSDDSAVRVVSLDGDASEAPDLRDIVRSLL